MSLKRNPISISNKIRAGITIGDPSGVGPEITAKAVRELNGFAEFTIIGDKWVFEKNQKKQNLNFIDLKNISRKKFRFGKIKAEYGRASVEYLDSALELLKTDEIDCLITCPISKEAINLAGYKYSGHTEYFSCRTDTENIVMILLNRKLKFSLLTRHIPLKDVSRNLNEEKVYQTISKTYDSLKELFFLRVPRIVVCGVNPHASDNGVIGNEENAVIRPVLERLEREGKHIDGPLSGDSAILKMKEGYYDCAIAAYHDQALIPLKFSDKKTGVNLTLGLPFIRTSPLHGTAFDIADKNTADTGSLIEAIKLAVRCALNRRKT